MRTLNNGYRQRLLHEANRQRILHEAEQVPHIVTSEEDTNNDDGNESKRLKVEHDENAQPLDCIEVHDMFIFVCNYHGSEDAQSRWGDVGLIPVTALDETPLLKRIISSQSLKEFSVLIDTSGSFPKAEDTRHKFFETSSIDDASMNHEFLLLSDSLLDFSQTTNIVGRVVYHTSV